MRLGELFRANAHEPFVQTNLSGRPPDPRLSFRARLSMRTEERQEDSTHPCLVNQPSEPDLTSAAYRPQALRAQIPWPPWVNVISSKRSAAAIRGNMHGDRGEEWSRTVVF